MAMPVTPMTRAGKGLNENAYEGGGVIDESGRAVPDETGELRNRRTALDSRRQPISPANQNLRCHSSALEMGENGSETSHMTAMLMCWTSLTVYGSSGPFPSRSIHVWVLP